MKKLFLILTAILVCNTSFGQFQVLPNENVGIGTDSPEQKLHVKGNTHLQGSTTIGSNSSGILASFIEILGATTFTPKPKLASSAKVIIGTYDYAINLFPLIINTHPAIYGNSNGSLSVGTPDNWSYRVYAYDINYQNLINGSDMRLKENIKPCPSFLSKLKNVKSYNYNYKDEYFKDFEPEQKQRAQKTEFGFIAQEFQKIFPELVHEDESNGMLGINYVSMIPILTSAINELQQEKESQQTVIETLQQKVEALEKALTNCCTKDQLKPAEKSSQPFDLTEDAATEALKVYQNAPNPFNEHTTVQCYIPQAIQKAELCVYDMQGARVKCLLVSERGTVDIQIQAGQLAAGIYTYLLIGDAKTSDAKQMILTK